MYGAHCTEELQSSHTAARCEPSLVRLTLIVEDGDRGTNSVSTTHSLTEVTFLTLAITTAAY